MVTSSVALVNLANFVRAADDRGWEVPSPLMALESAMTSWKRKKKVSLNEIGHGTRREYDSGIGYGFHRKQRYLDKETSIVIQVLVVE